jgi:hypothetical protein
MPTPSTALAFGDADIPALMADMGIAVTVGGVAGIGLLDEADQILVQDLNRGEVVATITTLTIQTSAFPNVAIDGSVVVGTRTFTVRERLRESDGGLTKLLLGNAAPISVILIDGGNATPGTGSGPDVDGGSAVGGTGSGPDVDCGGA